MSVVAGSVSVSLSEITLSAIPQTLNANAALTISMQAITAKALFPIGSPVNIKDGDGMTSWHPADNITSIADWSNESNAELEDGNAASATIPGFSAVGFMYFQGHNFTTDDIPSGAIVLGIEVDTKRAGQIAGDIYESSNRLINGAGTPIGDFKGNFDWYALYGTGVIGERHSWRNVILGDPTDDWNANMLDTDIIDSEFGIRWQVHNGDVSPQTVEIDFNVIRVYWTLNQTISMGAITLTSSVQGLVVVSTVTISVSVVTLTSSAQGLSVVKGGVSISMSIATLVAAPQVLSYLTPEPSELLINDYLPNILKISDDAFTIIENDYLPTLLTITDAPIALVSIEHILVAMLTDFIHTEHEPR
ncbi:MAG: hypothetical protein GQ524_11710 [Anaerolineales bacterium]|nr:hypothetical protein [Anaerolineales bacterium]